MVQKLINEIYPWWCSGSRNEEVINVTYPWWASGSRNEKTIDPPNHLIRDANRVVEMHHALNALRLNDDRITVVLSFLNKDNKRGRQY